MSESSKDVREPDRRELEGLHPSRRNTNGAKSPCQACTVRDLSICDALEEKDLARLESIVVNIRVAPGQAVMYEDDPAEHLYVLTGGCVKIFKLLVDGRRQITGFLFPSDFLGLAMQDRYAYGAEAVTPAQLCRFPRRRLEALFDEFPRLERRLLGVASNELVAAQDQMLLLGRKSAREKLATFLYTLLRRAELRGDDTSRLNLPMGRSDIADYLGLTIETVSRGFTRLKAEGLIAFETPQELVIRNFDALADISGLMEGTF